MCELDCGFITRGLGADAYKQPKKLRQTKGPNMRKHVLTINMF